MEKKEKSVRFDLTAPRSVYTKMLEEVAEHRKKHPEHKMTLSRLNRIKWQFEDDLAQ
jgi:hypothetical protein